MVPGNICVAGSPDTRCQSFLVTVISPLSRRSCLACGLVLAGIRLTVKAAPVASEEKPAAPASLSPHLKTALSTGLFAYDSAKSTAGEDANKLILGKTNAGAGEVHVLPRFIIRESPPPKTEDLLTSAGKLDRYLGPKEGLDRGLLNKVVLRWGDGVVGVALFDANKNETRAKVREMDDKRLQHRAELLDLTAQMKETGDEDFAKELKRQSDHLFSREPPFNRK